KLIVKKVDAQNLKDYDRIRKFHGDAAVRVRKNSCSGCFSLIPQQIIVELRNNLNKLYFCENCGRIMYPEEILITDKLLDEL
ncbi:MAG: uncharacterized protein QG635_2424, partial [Bacteroidota bacterium]|nr:uncharacterized protein [Bacteroidota bacterium]